jgi:hypothetical protein
MSITATLRQLGFNVVARTSSERDDDKTLEDFESYPRELRINGHLFWIERREDYVVEYHSDKHRPDLYLTFNKAKNDFIHIELGLIKLEDEDSESQTSTLKCQRTFKQTMETLEKMFKDRMSDWQDDQ